MFQGTVPTDTSKFFKKGHGHGHVTPKFLVIKC